MGLGLAYRCFRGLTIRGTRRFLVARCSEHRRDLDGLAVYLWNGDETAVEKLRQVLWRIDVLDARVLARLRKSRVIMHVTDTLSMSYNPFSNAIWIPREELEKLDVDVLACRFVHEATHARVARTIRTSRWNLERVEHVSLDQEIGMLERIVLAGTTMNVIHYLTWWRQARLQPNASQAIRKERIRQELETIKPPRVLKWLIFRLNGISSDTDAAA